jgi:hypothetical protein
MTDPFDRAVARERLERQERTTSRVKAGFTHHLKVYVAVNLLLVAIWALTDRSYFWPAWSMLGWGIGLYFHWSQVRHHERRDRQMHDELGSADL